MNLGIVALIVLIVVIAVGFVKKLNVGMLAMAAAIVLGYMTKQYTKSEILSGYSASLFITLLGLTLLFGIITANGCLDLLMRKLINLFGKQVWLIPVLLFVSGWAVSAFAGGFAGMAFVCGITLPVVHATDYNPIMMMIISNAGAQAGRYTRISPDGNIVLNLLAEQGIDGGLMVLTVNMTIAMAVISLCAFIYFKGYKVKSSGEQVKLEAGNFTGKQWTALIVFLAMIVSVIVFGQDSGLMGLTAAVLLLLLGVVDEKTAFRTIPWNTIMMVTGVGVLMNIVIESGGIDILTNAIGSVTNSVTVGGVSSLTASIMSWFSSTLGVVVPTLTPTVQGLAEQVGGTTALSILSCMLIGSSSACFSPASSVGGLVLSTVVADPKYKDTVDENKTFVLLFLWSVTMAVISALLATAGLYRIVG